MTSRIELASISRDLRERILVVFSLFPRKSASVLLFRETVQTQYLNKRKKKVHKNSVVPSKHFSNPPNPQTFVSLFGRGPMDRTLTDRSFQDSPGKYLEESRPRNTSKSTWTSPRGASCRPDSNRHAWPQAPGAGGRGVPKTLVQGEAFAALCVWGGRSWLLGG